MMEFLHSHSTIVFDLLALIATVALVAVVAWMIYRWIKVRDLRKKLEEELEDLKTAEGESTGSI